MVSDVYVPVQHCVIAVFVAGITEVVNGVVVGITVIDVFDNVKGMHSSIQVKFNCAAWNVVIVVEIIG